MFSPFRIFLKSFNVQKINNINKTNTKIVKKLCVAVYRVIMQEDKEHDHWSLIGFRKFYVNF